MGHRLELITLGSLQIKQAGEPLTGFASRKERALLIYLAVEQRPHSRAALAGLLWSDLLDTRARGNLRRALSHLRRLVGPHLLITPCTVAFDPQSDYWLDVEGLVRLESCSPHSQFPNSPISQLPNLYNGDFLEGFYLRGAPLFEEWALSWREQVRTSALRVLHRGMSYHSARGEHAEAIGWAEQLLALDPWREEVHRELMRLLALTGQRGAALAQYEKCCRLLREELGVEPLEETKALYHRLGTWEIAELGNPPSQSTHSSILRRGSGQVPNLPFTGRGSEYAALAAGWEQARRGVGRLTLVEGEAGVGKSRLVEEATRQAQTEGTVVLRGRCYEFGGSLPYQPIAEALRSVPQAELPIAHLDPVWLAELACLLPEVRQRRPDLPDPAASNGEAARQRLFESVARLLSPPQGQPLIFFLDDLHWADQATLDLLHYLVRRLKEAPTWLLGVYRSEEVALGHPLVQLRLGLERDHCVEALALGPLSEAAVQQIARALAGEQDSAALGAFLHQKSEGNPFVLSEMVEALREGGALREGDGGWVFEQTRLPEIANALPSGVRAVILQRVGRLSETAQRLLALAAVIGRQFDLPLLQAAAGSGDVVDESMEEWLPRRLVKPETSSTVHIRHSFDFSHDRIREAVYQAVRPEQRRTLHRQVAQALEELADRIEANLGLLAHHWEQAGETDKAADYLLRAGDQARLLYAHQEAVDYYRRALVYLEKSGRQEEAARVLMRLGLTHHNAFQFRQARQAYDQGIALWQQAGAARPTSSAVAAGHTLRVRWLEPTTLDPAASLDDHTAALMSHLFSGLVGLDPAMYIVPDVAHAWEITEDGRRFTFHLRDDMCWSDGQAVTAQDFEYAWKRALNPYLGLPRATFFYDIKGAKAYHQGAGRAEEVGTHAMDATTLQVELAEPTGYFLQLLTYPAFYPVPRRQVEQYGPAWAEAEHIVTNGPFRLAQWQQGQSLTLERASTYHGPCTGNLQQVVLKSISDWQARLQAYEADELDVLGITYFPVEAREQARQRHAGEYISKPTLGVNYIVMDAHRPPFDDARVRRALVMATDRERLANIVLGGYAAPATGGFVPPGIPGHSPGIGLAYDPVAARRLLAQAGYPDGRGFPAVPALSYDAAAARCRYLGEQWRENLGLEVEWQIVEWAVYLDRLRGTPPSLVIMTWLADYPDPDNFLRVSHERAWPWWRNEAYGCLLAQAKKPTVQAERMALYQQADRLLIEATVALPLVYERGHLLVKPWVRRYPMSAVRTAFWKDVVLG